MVKKTVTIYLYITIEERKYITLNTYNTYTMCFPGGSDGKESAYNVGDLGSSPGSGRSPGEGNGNPLQYSCLDSFKDRGT